MAQLSHKRETNARRKPRAALVAGPIALLATASLVTLGVLAANPTVRDAIQVQGATTVGANGSARDRDVLSRSAPRIKIKQLPSKADAVLSAVSTRRAIKNAHTKLWTSTTLNLWTEPGAKAKQLGEIEAAKRVLVTGRNLYGREEIVLDGASRWVTKGYLSGEKPLGVGAGLSMDPCPDPGVESGLTSNAVFVYRSVCHAFPQITTYGGWDAHGEHASGRAIDIMTSDVTLGTAIADFLRLHAAELNLYDVIWQQQIFTQERGGEGWRAMSDRGSTTANHYDHVHVSTY